MKSYLPVRSAAGPPAGERRVSTACSPSRSLGLPGLSGREQADRASADMHFVVDSRGVPRGYMCVGDQNHTARPRFFDGVGFASDAGRGARAGAGTRSLPSGPTTPFCSRKQPYGRRSAVCTTAKRLPRSLIEGETLQGNKLDRAAAGQPNGHHPRSAYQLWRGGLYLCAPTAPCAFACTSAPSGGRATPGEGDMWARGSETNASIGSTEVMASSVSGPLQPANTTTARRGHPQ